MPDPNSFEWPGDPRSLERQVRLAASDPGAFVPRGDNHTEQISHWVTRAVLTVVEPEINSLWDQIHRDQHDAMEGHERADELQRQLSLVTAERDRWIEINGELREEHDVRRKALADILEQGYHLNWDQLLTWTKDIITDLVAQRDQAEAERDRLLPAPDLSGYSALCFADHHDDCAAEQCSCPCHCGDHPHELNTF